jgi:hypothetical protein
MKTIELTSYTMIENVDDKEIKNELATYIKYLKDNGVFSYGNIIHQLVGFGSLFYLALISDQNNNMIIQLLFGLGAIIYASVNIKLFTLVKNIRFD